MTDKLAVIKATFSDFRVVKGRKVAQLIFETPIEGADHALAVLGGVPRPDQEAWCAIARLVDGTGKPVTREKEQKSTKASLTRQAAIMCGEPTFTTFLRENYPLYHDPVNAVREICGVMSRSEFDSDPAAGERWRKLKGEYDAWMEVQ